MSRRLALGGASWWALVAIGSACSPSAHNDPGPQGHDQQGTGGEAQSGGASGEVASGGAASSSGGTPSAPSGGQTHGSGGDFNATGGTSSGAGGSPSSGGAPDGELLPLTIFLAGDSTVSTYADTASSNDQAGWGQMLSARFDERVTVENRAIGGRTARRFIDEGSLDQIWADAQAGDYLFVQFGTNDGNKTATYELDGQTIPYYLDPSTDFPRYLMQYVAGAHERSMVPVLVTPPPRNSAYCTGGNGTGAHAQAMRDLGEAEDVVVLDLNARTVAHLQAICPAPSPEDFFLLRSDGSVDGTHFQENGARFLAGFVTAELEESAQPLAGYLLPQPDPG